MGINPSVRITSSQYCTINGYLCSINKLFIINSNIIAAGRKTNKQLNHTHCSIQVSIISKCTSQSKLPLCEDTVHSVGGDEGIGGWPGGKTSQNELSSTCFWEDICIDLWSLSIRLTKCLFKILYLKRVYACVHVQCVCVYHLRTHIHTHSLTLMATCAASSPLRARPVTLLVGSLMISSGPSRSISVLTSNSLL